LQVKHFKSIVFIRPYSTELKLLNISAEIGVGIIFYTVSVSCLTTVEEGMFKSGN